MGLFSFLKKKKYEESSKAGLRSDVNVHLKRGLAYGMQGKIEQSILEFQEALKVNPNDAIAHYSLGNTYKEQGNLEEAIVELREALRIDQNFTEAYYHMGTAYVGQMRTKEAIECFHKFIKAQPKDLSKVKLAEEVIRNFS